jgi:hypothetical protein
MSRAARWLHKNRYGLLGAVLGCAMIGLIGPALALGGGVIGFAAGHWLDGRADADAGS